MTHLGTKEPSPPPSSSPLPADAGAAVRDPDAHPPFIRLMTRPRRASLDCSCSRSTLFSLCPAASHWYGWCVGVCGWLPGGIVQLSIRLAMRIAWGSGDRHSGGAVRFWGVSDADFLAHVPQWPPPP